MFHDAPGVSAVAGYRMGQRALKDLGPSLTLVHQSAVQLLGRWLASRHNGQRRKAQSARGGK